MEAVSHGVIAGCVMVVVVMVVVTMVVIGGRCVHSYCGVP